jgi:hypothetical protein
MPGQQDTKDGSIRISVEGVRGDPLGIAVNWGPEEGAAAALAVLVELWTRAGSYPGNSVLDPTQIFPPLIDTLDLAIQSRRSRGEDQLSPIIEKLSKEWLLTDYGLEHLLVPYWIEGKELAEDVEGWRRHMREKTWVLEENKRAQAAGEPDFWLVSEIASKFFERKLMEQPQEK